jgi:hypothetical protein
MIGLSELRHLLHLLAHNTHFCARNITAVDLDNDAKRNRIAILSLSHVSISRKALGSIELTRIL